jgi:hypothetical protein
MTDYRTQFIIACERGQIEIADRLVQDHQVDVHDENGQVFVLACFKGDLEIVKWLANKYHADVHVRNEDPFKWACEKGHVKIIKWFIKKYRYSESPYYYYNETAYILNQEPLNGWQSCTILGCPIIYIGELDEPAVITYMTTLKKPKSARS